MSRSSNNSRNNTSTVPVRVPPQLHQATLQMMSPHLHVTMAAVAIPPQGRRIPLSNPHPLLFPLTLPLPLLPLTPNPLLCTPQDPLLIPSRATGLPLPAVKVGWWTLGCPVLCSNLPEVNNSQINPTPHRLWLHLSRPSMSKCWF